MFLEFYERFDVFCVILQINKVWEALETNYGQNWTKLEKRAKLSFQRRDAEALRVATPSLRRIC